MTYLDSLPAKKQIKKRDDLELSSTLIYIDFLLLRINYNNF